MISCAGIAAILEKYGHGDAISITGHVKAGLPPFKLPDFSYTQGNVTHTTGDVFGVGLLSFSILYESFVVINLTKKLLCYIVVLV